jgi:hypothetical protein
VLFFLVLPVLAGIAPLALFGIMFQFKAYRIKKKVHNADLTASKQKHVQFAVVTMFVVLFLIYPSVLKELFLTFINTTINFYYKMPDYEYTTYVKDKPVETYLNSLEEISGAQAEYLDVDYIILVSVSLGGNNATTWQRHKSQYHASMLGLIRNGWHHDTVKVFVLIFVILWGLGIPIIPQIFVFLNRKRLQDEYSVKTYGFLYIGYKTQEATGGWFATRHWEITYFLRKFILQLILVFLKDEPYTQTFACLVLVTVCLLAHMMTSPYERREWNFYETLSLVSTWFTLMAGILSFASRPEVMIPTAGADASKDAEAMFLTVAYFLIGLNGATLVVLGYGFISEVKHKVLLKVAGDRDANITFAEFLQGCKNIVRGKGPITPRLPANTSQQSEDAEPELQNIVAAQGRKAGTSRVEMRIEQRKKDKEKREQERLERSRAQKASLKKKAVVEVPLEEVLKEVLKEDDEIKLDWESDDARNRSDYSTFSEESATVESIEDLTQLSEESDDHDVESSIESEASPAKPASTTPRKHDKHAADHHFESAKPSFDQMPSFDPTPSGKSGLKKPSAIADDISDISNFTEKTDKWDQRELNEWDGFLASV